MYTVSFLALPCYKTIYNLKRIIICFYLRFTGKLDVKVDGPTKTDITRKDHGDKCDISFLPMTPGIYNIIVKYNGKEMKGSPFVSKVSGI